MHKYSYEALLQANEIIKKLQGDLKTLMGKMKLKNTVTIQQEKLLAEKEEMLQKERKESQDAGQALRAKEQEVVTVSCFWVVGLRVQSVSFPTRMLNFSLVG